MTVMVETFFGIPQAFIRSGLCAKMKAGEVRLYLCLMHRSERYCTREFVVTDADVRTEVGAAPRTLCNARKRLQEHGLIQYSRLTTKNAYKYTICDLATGKPYPGDPKKQVRYKKRSERNPNSERSLETPAPQPTSHQANNHSHFVPERQEENRNNSLLNVRGLPGVFDGSDDNTPF